MTSRTPRIVVGTFPNECIRKYDVNTRISNTRYRETFGKPDSVTQLVGFEPVDEKTQALIDSLHGVDGVVDVGLDTYYVRIEISPAFSWEDDVEPQVLERIKDNLDWSHKVVEVRNPKKEEMSRTRQLAEQLLATVQAARTPPGSED